MAANVVDFECVAPDHAATSQHPDKLTIHQGRWAFCAFDALTDGHAWQTTGGVSLAELLRHAGIQIVAPPQTHDEAKPRERSASAR